MKPFSMKKGQKQQSTTQNNVEDNPNKESTLIDYEKIEGTPFTLVHMKEQKQWFLVMGDHRLTEPTNTRNESLEKLETEKWMIQMIMTSIVVHKINEENQKDAEWISKTRQHFIEHGKKKPEDPIEDKVRRNIHGMK